MADVQCSRCGSMAAGLERVPLPGEGHYAGIRPEKIVIAGEGLAVEVSAVDYMGAETVLRLRHGDNTIMARVDGRADAVDGDQLHITWNASDVHLFDQSGNRM